MPDEFADPVEIAQHVGARLDAVEVEWVIGGSLASSVHGEARATQDIDVVVDLQPHLVHRLVKALDRDYYIDADAVRDAVESPSSFNAVHYLSALKIDFFVAGNDLFEAERLAQRQRIDMPTGVLYVDTAEHTVLRKLEWYRRGGETSERQWRDVQAILRLQGDRLDRERLHHWAAYLGVTDLLDRVMGTN